MPPTTVTLSVETTIDDGQLQVQLDGKKILSNTGSVNRHLTKGQKYFINWFVKGSPGSKYSIKITAPDAAKMSRSKTLTQSGKDGNTFSFKP